MAGESEQGELALKASDETIPHLLFKVKLFLLRSCARRAATASPSSSCCVACDVTKLSSQLLSQLSHKQLFDTISANLINQQTMEKVMNEKIAGILFIIYDLIKLTKTANIGFNLISGMKLERKKIKLQH